MDEYTPQRPTNEGGDGLWPIILSVIKSNIAFLLQDEAFKELLLELPDLNFRLLSMLGSPTASGPSVYKPKLVGFQEDDEDGEPPHPSLRSSVYGRGRVVGFYGTR